jgi:hypothetical protein
MVMDLQEASTKGAGPLTAVEMEMYAVKQFVRLEISCWDPLHLGKVSAALMDMATEMDQLRRRADLSAVEKALRAERIVHSGTLRCKLPTRFSR